jgi:hypothetical protein
MLGLGLGLNRNNKIFGGGGVDPRITAAITANATMLLMGDLANGTSPGNNTDPTSTWKDLINSNDATAFNHAWTPSSGWDAVTVPSGTEQMDKGDGADDYWTVANHASINPTGTEDFAICGVFRTDVVLDNGWLFCKNEQTNLADTQYSLLLLSSGAGRFRSSGVSINIPDATFVADEINTLEIKKIGSTIKIIINEIEIINQSFTQNLVSRPNFNIFNRSSNAGNTTHTEFNNSYLGYLAFFYNGATGLNETDVDTACALLRAPYF